jgi:hypothetical protein
MSSLEELLVDGSCDSECRKTASVSDFCESSRNTPISVCRVAQSEDIVIGSGNILCIKNDITILGTENTSRMAFRSDHLDTKNEDAEISFDSKQMLISNQNTVDSISHDRECTCEGGEEVIDSLIAKLDNGLKPSTEPNNVVDTPATVRANSPGLENQMSYQLLSEAGMVEVVENKDFIDSENVGQIRGSEDVFECKATTLQFTKDYEIVVDISKISPEYSSKPEIQGTAITSPLHDLEDFLPSLEHIIQVKINEIPKSLELSNSKVEVPLNAEVHYRSKGESVDNVTLLAIKIEVGVKC